MRLNLTAKQETQLVAAHLAAVFGLERTGCDVQPQEIIPALERWVAEPGGDRDVRLTVLRGCMVRAQRWVSADMMLDYLNRLVKQIDETKQTNGRPKAAA